MIHVLMFLFFVLFEGVRVGVCKLNNGCEMLLLFCREILEPHMHALE